MRFTSSFITTVGNTLLTQAVSGDRIIWSKCGCSHVTNQASITASTTDFDNFVCKGQAVAVFDQGDGTAKLSCSMTNGADGCTAGDADVFGLWAHIETASGSVGDDVLVLIAKRGESAATYFPQYDPTDETTSLLGIVDCSVTISDGVVQSIEVSRTAYALAQDLMHEVDLRESEDERMLSCHTSDSELEGEDQDVYGKKNFKEETTISSAIISDIEISQTAQGVKSMIYQPDSAYKAGISFDCRPVGGNTGAVTVQGDLLPGIGDHSIGAEDNHWGAAYIDEMTVVAFGTEELHIDGSGSKIFFNEISEIRDDGGAIVISPDAEIKAEGDLIPSVDDTYTLGDADHKWSTVITNGLAVNEDAIVNNLVVGTKINTAGLTFNNATLSASNYAHIPQPFNGAQIGGIFLALLRNGSNDSQTITSGQTIQSEVNIFTTYANSSPSYSITPEYYGEFQLNNTGSNYIALSSALLSSYDDGAIILCVRVH